MAVTNLILTEASPLGGGSGGNSVTATLAFGASFTDKAQTVVVGQTWVTLATTESATSKAPRRVSLGQRSVAAGSVALTQLGTLWIQLKSPIVVHPGEFVQVVKKKIGTAPSAGVVAHAIAIDSHYA